MAWKKSGPAVAISSAVEGRDYPREWGGAITCPQCNGRGGRCCDDGSGIGVGLAPAWELDPEITGYPHERRH